MRATCGGRSRGRAPGKQRFCIGRNPEEEPNGWNSGWKRSSEKGWVGPLGDQAIAGRPPGAGARLQWAGPSFPSAGAPAGGGGRAGRLLLGGDHVVDGLALF